jgi:hypothetical protein
MWNSLLDGLLAHGLYDLLILAGGIALGVLKKRNAKWAAIIAYGLGGCTLVAILIFTFTGHAILSMQQPETTAANVETNIRAWADNINLGVTKEQPGQDYDFLYLITLRSGGTVLVGRAKRRESYIQFQANVTVSKDHRDLLAKLSKDQQDRVVQETALELARFRVGYGMAGPPLSGVLLTKAVPITTGLTEATFIGYLDEMDDAIELSEESIVLSIERNSSSH